MNAPRLRLPLDQRPHALYRFYDHAGRLLYIGITSALSARLSNHGDTKPWWVDVANITVSHYVNRDEVLAAERAAIISERPLWNVKHNTGSSPKSPNVTAADEADHWLFSNRRGRRFKSPLQLRWHLTDDAISDDFRVEDIGAEDLWHEWRSRLGRDKGAEAQFSPGAVRITWFVCGDGILELAPSQERPPATSPFETTFLDRYSWPRSADGSQRLQWARLPVEDKSWRRGTLPRDQIRKGGFIQEVTGWKPAPMQPYVNLSNLARMTDLSTPMRHARNDGRAVA